MIFFKNIVAKINYNTRLFTLIVFCDISYKNAKAIVDLHEEIKRNYGVNKKENGHEK